MTMPRHWRGTLRAAMRTEGYTRHRPRDMKALRRRLEAGEPLDRAVRRTVKQRGAVRDWRRLVQRMAYGFAALAPAVRRFASAAYAIQDAVMRHQAATAAEESEQP